MARVSGSDNAKGNGGGNIPLYAVITIGIMVVSMVVLVLVANPATAPSLPLVLGLFATTIPSLVGAVFAERASRDIRNGVVVDKAKEGVHEALREIHSHGPVPLHSHLDPEDPVVKANPHSHPKEAPNG